MFVPEYSITLKTLGNIATIEYARAIVDNAPILPNFQLKLQKEARNEFGINTGIDIRKLQETEISAELEEESIKDIRKALNANTKYRQVKKEGKTPPEELLAEISELFDWYNSLDAKETHPIIVAGIMNAQLELISPYAEFNTATAFICTSLVMKANNYSLNRYLLPSKYYANSKKEYETALASIIENEYDFTSWLEFFTEGTASEASNIEQKVKLLARDTKLSKSTGRADLTERQERIIEYLQDYGMIQSKQFTKLFPDVSGDSILRDLKKLMDLDIVAKRGSTKSSRYELR